MSAKNQVAQLAFQIATDILQTAKQLEPEFLQLEQRKLEIQAQFDSANLCFERLNSFRPEIEGHLQCPGCWIRSERQTNLTPLSSQPEAEQLFRCDLCELDYSVPG
jgi:hypothetical protein